MVWFPTESRLPKDIFFRWISHSGMLGDFPMNHCWTNCLFRWICHGGMLGDFTMNPNGFPQKPVRFWAATSPRSLRNSKLVVHSNSRWIPMDFLRNQPFSPGRGLEVLWGGARSWPVRTSPFPMNPIGLPQKPHAGWRWQFLSDQALWLVWVFPMNLNGLPQKIDRVTNVWNAILFRGSSENCWGTNSQNTKVFPRNLVSNILDFWWIPILKPTVSEGFGS